MPKPSLEALQKQLDELNERQDRVEGNVSGYENALLAGENDLRLVLALRDSSEALNDIAFERGKIEGRLEDLRALEMEQANDPIAQTQDEMIAHDNWYERLGNDADKEASQSPAKAEHERVSTVDEKEWWQSNDDPDHVDDLDLEPDRTR